MNWPLGLFLVVAVASGETASNFEVRSALAAAASCQLQPPTSQLQQVKMANGAWPNKSSPNGCRVPL
eukprot:scaffold108057_cov37-Tisochrysis_lutea.AAC.2